MLDEKLSVSGQGDGRQPYSFMPLAGLSVKFVRNPDFAAYARAFGGFGITVENTADFPAAFQAAEESGQPAIIHLRIDPEAITPTQTLAKIRESALAQHDG